MDVLDKKTRRILIVDDDVVIRWMYGRFVAKMGYEAEDVSSIAEARAALARDEFDLILLDMHLADGHGAAVITAARAGLDGRKTPVIVISSDDDCDLIARMHAQGAAEFLRKPVTFDHLAAVLERWIAS